MVVKGHRPTYRLTSETQRGAGRQDGTQAIDGRGPDLAGAGPAQFWQQPVEHRPGRVGAGSRCVDHLDCPGVAEAILRVDVGGQAAQDPDGRRLDDRVGAGVHPHPQHRILVQVGQVLAHVR